MILKSILACALLSLTFGCGSHPDASSLMDFDQVSSSILREDGRYDVICKNGNFETVTKEQILADAVCDSVPSPDLSWISVQLRSDGRYTVICKDLTHEIATADEITGNQVCQGRNYPQPPLSTIAVGELHSCAIDKDGVKCWGDNKFGQTNVPSLKNPRQVSAKGGNTCALDDDGVKCWGCE